MSASPGSLPEQVWKLQCAIIPISRLVLPGYWNLCNTKRSMTWLDCSRTCAREHLSGPKRRIIVTQIG